ISRRDMRRLINLGIRSMAPNDEARLALSPSQGPRPAARRHAREADPPAGARALRYRGGMRWSLESLEKHLLIGSTLVEGSTLSEEDAEHVLAGRTISGHPIHELRELLNYRAAVEWLMKELLVSPFLSVDLVLGFHRRLFAGLP